MEDNSSMKLVALQNDGLYIYDRRCNCSGFKRQADNPFTDVKTTDYFYKAVLWAYENGITSGTTATSFEPTKNVSRAQTVAFLWRYEGKPVVNYYMNMTDVASGKYYTEAVRWVLAEKITVGTTTTTFSPKKDCLRGQIVTFLYKNFAE